MKLENFERLLLWRLRLGFEQREWAEGFGIGQSMMSQVEWGKRKMSDSLLADFFAMEGNRTSEDRRDKYGMLAPTKGEQLRIRCRRLGMNMAQSAQFFRISEQFMLDVYRDQRPLEARLEHILVEKERLS